MWAEEVVSTLGLHQFPAGKGEWWVAVVEEGFLGEVPGAGPRRPWRLKSWQEGGQILSRNGGGGEVRIEVGGVRSVEVNTGCRCMR